MDTNNLPKLYVGPVTQDIFDVCQGFKPTEVGLIPSRRQIDYDRGYTGLITADLHKLNKSNLIIERDHGGPEQGQSVDNGLDSLINDCYEGFNIIHIDPWKVSKTIREAAARTCQLIQFCSSYNPQTYFEIGTEESVYPYTTDELITFLALVKFNLLPSEWKQVLYVVIQSGVGLDLVNQKNTGTLDMNTLGQQIKLIHSYGLKAKEHNGDYLSKDDIKARFWAGLDAINVAPEFGQLEASVYKALLMREEIDCFKAWISHNHYMWNKWIGNNTEYDSIILGGHYAIFELQSSIPKNRKEYLSSISKEVIKNRINEYLEVIND